MARRVRAPATLLSAMLVLLVAACDSTSPTAPAPDPTSAPATEGPRSPMPTTRADGRTLLTLTVGDREFTAEIGDSPPARALLAQLPLRLGFRDLNGVEKVAALPRPLTMDGVPPGADPEIDDLGYYAPTGELVLYYGEVGYFEGIVRLGRLDPALSAVLQEGPDEVEVSVALS